MLPDVELADLMRKLKRDMSRNPDILRAAELVDVVLAERVRAMVEPTKKSRAAYMRDYRAKRLRAKRRAVPEPDMGDFGDE